MGDRLTPRPSGQRWPEWGTRGGRRLLIIRRPGARRHQLHRAGASPTVISVSKPSARPDPREGTTPLGATSAVQLDQLALQQTRSKRPPRHYTAAAATNHRRPRPHRPTTSSGESPHNQPLVRTPQKHSRPPPPRPNPTTLALRRGHPQQWTRHRWEKKTPSLGHRLDPLSPLVERIT